MDAHSLTVTCEKAQLSFYIQINSYRFNTPVYNEYKINENRQLAASEVNVKTHIVSQYEYNTVYKNGIVLVLRYWQSGASGRRSCQAFPTFCSKQNYFHLGVEIK